MRPQGVAKTTLQASVFDPGKIEHRGDAMVSTGMVNTRERVVVRSHFKIRNFKNNRQIRFSLRCLIKAAVSPTVTALWGRGIILR